MAHIRTATCASVLAIGLLFWNASAQAQSQNTFTGTSAGAHTTGSFNSGYGYQSLYTNTSGQENTAVGWDSLIFNNTGGGNVAVGENVMRFNSSGSENVAVGHSALIHNNADENVAIGSSALSQNTSGTENVAVGTQALSSNTSASGNTAVGYASLTSTTSPGSFNTAVGSFALFADTTGTVNTAVGSSALQSNLTGIQNVAIGADALFSNVSNSSNVAVGGTALYSCTAEGNTAIGDHAMDVATTGSDNVAVGQNAGNSISAGSFNVAVGLQSGGTGDFSHTVALGALSTTFQDGDIQFGDNSFTTRIGGYRPYTNMSDARFKIDVTANVPGIEFIKRLRPVTYRWDMVKLAQLDGNAKSLSAISEALREQNGRELNTGFLAQEVESAAKEIGYEFSGISKPQNDKAPYGLAYSEFVVPLVKAVQEQQQEIEQLRASLKVAQLDKHEPAQHSSMLTDNPTSLAVLGCVLGLLVSKRRKESSTN